MTGKDRRRRDMTELQRRHADDPWPDVPGPQMEPSLPWRGGERWIDRALGCVVGSAVGDALGAPFEFGPAGAFSKRFPEGSTENEMIGNHLWEAGEFTDDTQMAILEALAYLEGGDVNSTLPIAFRNFVQWKESGPKDVGISTSAVLSDPAGFPTAAIEYFYKNPGGAAGNGSLMRVSFIGSRWSFSNYTGTMEVARKFSAVTHGDPAAGEGRALLQALIYWAVHLGSDAFAEPLEWAIAYLDEDHRDLYASLMSRNPPMDLPNGTVWGCLRDATMAVRRTDSFEECMRMACDVGDDVDTVAAVAGALAGSIYGLAAIPERWLEPLHGDVLGTTYDAAALIDLAKTMLAE